MLQRTLAAGFIAPCLPTKTDKLPSGDGWLHEIKHDGFRIIARKTGAQVRLYSRPGNDLTGSGPPDVTGTVIDHSTRHPASGFQVVSGFCLEAHATKVIAAQHTITKPMRPPSLGGPISFRSLKAIAKGLRPSAAWPTLHRAQRRALGRINSASVRRPSKPQQ
jgi:hypothetical protein